MSKSELDKIKPCPFCGKMPMIKSDIRYPRPKREAMTAYEVVCNNYRCIIYNADNNYYKTEAKAIEAWNRRAE